MCLGLWHKTLSVYYCPLTSSSGIRCSGQMFNIFLSGMRILRVVAGFKELELAMEGLELVDVVYCDFTYFGDD